MYLGRVYGGRITHALVVGGAHWWYHTTGMSIVYYCALGWEREGLPIMQMPVAEIHHKTIEVNGLTIQQVVFEDVYQTNRPHHLFRCSIVEVSDHILA